MKIMLRMTVLVLVTIATMTAGLLMLQADRTVTVRSETIHSHIEAVNKFNAS
jgi:hypothetical protein